jgi:hypothetical protein
VPILVEEESGTSLRPPLPEGDHDRTFLAAKSVPLAVAGLHHIFQDMPDHFVRQIPGDVLRAMVPKTDAPFPVHDVNPHRQVFQHMTEQLRIIEKESRHSSRRPFKQVTEKTQDIPVEAAPDPLFNATG